MEIGGRGAAMVYVEEEEAYFDAPLDKIWRLLQAHSRESAKIHPQHTNQGGRQVGENVSEVSWEEEIFGQRAMTKRRLTMYPPLGWTAVVLEGPLVGSKYFVYYAPRGDRTAVFAVGDFRSPAFSDSNVEAAAKSYFDRTFREDTAYLRTLR